MHIHETKQGEYMIVDAEKIIGEETNLRRAIEIAGDNFTYTPYAEKV